MNFYILASSFLWISVGLGLLWAAGDRVVRYAIELATGLHVTKFFIGFIVLAIAAGIPELAVAVAAAFTNVSQISAGDVIGANFSDVGLVSGLVLTLAGSIQLKRSDRLKIMYLLLLTVLVMGIIFMLGEIGKISGFFLAISYGIALFFIWKKREKHDIWHEEVEAVTHDIATGKDIILTSVVGIAIKLLISIAIVLGCSWLVVHYADILASSFGAQHETIGATICALGTSLPELAMSFAALKRKEFELALAPTLGSVLEHSMLVLGVLGMCSTSPVSFTRLYGAGIFMFAGFALMIVFLIMRRPLNRWQGLILLSLYVIYLAYELGFLIV